MVFFIYMANARAKFAKTGHDPHSSKLVVVCVVLCADCLYANVCCNTATWCQPNCS